MSDIKETKAYTLIALRGMVVFPSMVMHFDVGREKSVIALEKALTAKQRIFLSSQKDVNIDDPDKDDINTIGTICEVKQVLKMPGDTIRVLVEGISRGRIVEYLKTDEYFEVAVEALIDTHEKSTIEEKAYLRAVIHAFEQYARKSLKISNDAVLSVKEIVDLDKVTDIISSYVLFNTELKQEVLECIKPIDRLKRLLDILSEEIDIIEIENDINRSVKKQIDKSQREYYLREQIKAIQKELGEDSAVMSEAKALRERLDKKKLPKEVSEKCDKELQKLEKTSANSPELNVMVNYLDTIASMPWGKKTKDKMKLEHVQQILDEDHYGLDKVKERIVEYIAVLKMKKNMRGPILCFVGPPGVGKTSIARSIARAVGRKFVRMSLGGVRDEAEIRGHRRTYIGAIPGRVMTSIKQSGTDNPVFLFDEIDKMASDFRGDPASAMLEVLDPEINSTFRDHYLDVPYDLSSVMFVTTANTTETIPRPLLDRMEVIQLSSYTYEEKLEIAKRHLIRKQAEAHGLNKEKILFDDEAVSDIINLYTRESGVRNLEREIAAVCRKATSQLIQSGEASITVSKEMVREFLKAPRFTYDLVGEKDRVGVVNGLAWTATGGVTLNVEATAFKGTGQMQLTGMMGDVMKESAKTGLSLVRSKAPDLKIDPGFHKDKDLHIHIPEGAIPKDGPSAGITMVTAMVSVLTDRPVKRDIAMTGEVTLTGRVLAIGGLKEKVLAALRAGINKVIMPKENEKDFLDFPEDLQKRIEPYFVEEIDDVLEKALV